MTVNELIQKTGFEVISLADGERKIEGGYVGDLLSWVMGRESADNAWVTIMTNQNIIAVATLIDLSCIIIAENSEIDTVVVDLAKEKGVNILKTADNAFSVCRTLSALI
jgi:energy-converting hydrogenase Eha subunit B